MARNKSVGSQILRLIPKLLVAGSGDASSPKVAVTPPSHLITRLEKPPGQRATGASPTHFCDEASQLPTGRLQNSG